MRAVANSTRRTCSAHLPPAARITSAHADYLKSNALCDFAGALLFMCLLVRACTCAPFATCTQNLRFGVLVHVKLSLEQTSIFSYSYIGYTKASLAQLVEHRSRKAGVTSSSLVAGSSFLSLCSLELLNLLRVLCAYNSANLFTCSLQFI